MKNLNSSEENDLMKLGQLRDYYADYRSLPSYNYMKDFMRMGSKETICRLVAKLKEAKFLDTAPDKKLTPGQRFFEIPVSYESVQAGHFTGSYTEGGDFISILDILTKKPSISKVMPIKGDSMSDSGILDGDWAIYEQRPLANVGDIVVAMLDGENAYTIKELGKEGSQYVLIPHNKDFAVIRPNKDFHIRGVVMTTFRTYGRRFNALAP